VNRLENLDRRFPGRGPAIRHQMREDPSFRELCADYEAAAVALHYWLSPPHRSDRRAEDYRHLVSELAAAIEAALGG